MERTYEKVYKHMYDILSKIDTVSETEYTHLIPIYGCSDTMCKGFEIYEENDIHFCKMCGKRIVRLNSRIEMLYFNERLLRVIQLYLDRCRNEWINNE